MTPNPRPLQKGFTLFELILVLVILGIIGGMAAARLSAPGEYSVGYQAERLAADLRHVRDLAATWGHRLTFSATANNYTVTCVSFNGALPCINNGDIIRDPATSEPFQVATTDNVTLSATPVTTIDFDSLGRPNTTGGGLINATQEFRLTSSGGVVWSVTVEPLTGFVSVAQL